MSEEFQRAQAFSPQPVSVRQALQEGTKFLSQMGVESARLDAELLLGRVMGWGREKLYLNYEVPLGTHGRAMYHFFLRRRARREPISYITGQREFWSLDFLVTPEVLVPRAETELLIEVVLEVLGQVHKNFPLKVLDLGTGSGAIAVSLAKEWGDIEIWAGDLSREALEIARTNAARQGVKEKIHFFQGDLFESFRGQLGFFHVVVSNPPYVRRDEMQNLPPEVRDWEPRLAWDGGLDGLDLYRRIIQEGHLYLTDGGFMVLEIGADMRDKVSRLFTGVGTYSESSVFQDYAGRDRVFVARKLP